MRVAIVPIPYVRTVEGRARGRRSVATHRLLSFVEAPVRVLDDTHGMRLRVRSPIAAMHPDQATGVVVDGRSHVDLPEPVLSPDVARMLPPMGDVAWFEAVRRLSVEGRPDVAVGVLDLLDRRPETAYAGTVGFSDAAISLVERDDDVEAAARAVAMAERLVLHPEGIADADVEPVAHCMSDADGRLVVRRIGIAVTRFDAVVPAWPEISLSMRAVEAAGGMGVRGVPCGIDWRFPDLAVLARSIRLDAAACDGGHLARVAGAWRDVVRHARPTRGPDVEPDDRDRLVDALRVVAREMQGASPLFGWTAADVDRAAAAMAGRAAQPLEPERRFP